MSSSAVAPPSTLQKHPDTTTVQKKVPHRACIACKSRKVKCNGRHPVCQQCAHLNLRCEYPSVDRQKPRTRNKRGGVITQYKKKQVSPQLAKLEPKEGAQRQQRSSSSTLKGASPESLITAPSELQTKQFFRDRLKGYEENIYPVFPIISPQELKAAIDRVDDDKDDAALVYSLFGVTVGHSKLEGKKSGDIAVKLTNMALDSRGAIKPRQKDAITIRSIITSVSISSSLVALNEIEVAWLYLREACTMASILKLHDRETIKTWSLQERARAQRMYWMLYIHERFMAIHFYRPVVMSPLSVFPEQDESIPRGVHDGFLQIIKLFRLVDSNFINAYLAYRGSAHSDGHHSQEIVNETWIQQKQEEIINSESGMDKLSEMQQADLIVTQQWLRMLVWQMAMSRYWLNSGNSEGCMSILFPVEIAHKLRWLISKTSQSSIEVHGSAILRKLFELSIAIADVIILFPAQTLKERADRIEDYMWIANFLLRQSSFTSVQKQLLTEKLENVNSVFPHTPPPQPATEPAALLQNGVQSEDPWLSLSRPFTTRNDAEQGSGQPMLQAPLLLNLNTLSAMSQGLLNELIPYE